MAIGVYSKVVSTTRQIDTIHTFISGSRKKINSVWTFVNGERKQIFPSSEQYDEVYAKTDSGSYSQALTYGKYKIVISGAGGSGAAIARNSTSLVEINYIQNGYAGQQTTIYVDVLYGQTKTISGVVGQGGTAAYARADDTHDSASAGLGGTGYENGSNGSRASDRYATQKNGQNKTVSYGIASGGGGGSTSLLIDGVLTSVCVGGNGGSAKIDPYNHAGGTVTRTGGAGGSGGTTGGTGSAGGAFGQFYNNAGYSTAGTDGYIYIYKSSIYPNS